MAEKRSGGVPKKRIGTALVLMPPVVLTVLAVPTLGVALLMGGVVLVAAWEWGGLVGMFRPLYVSITAAMLLGVLYFFLQDAESCQTLLLFGLAFWCMALYVVLSYPKLPLWWKSHPAQVFSGWWVLVSGWGAVVALHAGYVSSDERGPEYTLFLLAMIWIADSAAYFSGRRWGKRRLAPRVSPAKTWEGCWGAAVSTILMALFGTWYFELGIGDSGLFVILCMATLMASVLGDLLESVIKRMHGAKDSGTLLPGHGGMLDRIDSLTAAAPVFVLGLDWLGKWS
ncbi:phosphatidate cytidylyltransferase [Gammaproteobacteria bacterium]